jgi:HK97 family phage major capsid protein
MSDIQEVKDLFSETQKTLTALRSDVEDLQGKTADFLDESRQEKMREELAKRFEAEQKAMQDRVAAVETAVNRPGVVGEKEEGEEKHFLDYLRSGVETPELKAMSTSTNADGGYVVTDGMETGIRKRLRRSGSLRSLANVVSFAGGSYDVLLERGDAGYEWAGEKGSRGETDTPTINRVSIPLHELSALPKVTQRILDNADFDIESWMTGYVADRFRRAEETAFISGDGVDKPKGILSYDVSTDTDDSRAANTLQYKATGASGTFNGADPANIFITTFYELQSAYGANATWLMKNTTAAATAVLQDGDGAYLLGSMLNSDGSIVRTIQGRPVELADDMPAMGANSYSIAVGDFEAGYTIVDGKAVTILRDPYSAKPYVLFYTTKRVGGGLVEADAIKLIKFGES